MQAPQQPIVGNIVQHEAGQALYLSQAHENERRCLWSFQLAASGKRLHASCIMGLIWLHLTHQACDLCFAGQCPAVPKAHEERMTLLCCGGTNR